MFVVHMEDHGDIECPSAMFDNNSVTDVHTYLNSLDNDVLNLDSKYFTIDELISQDTFMNKKQQLNILHLNIQGLRSSLMDLKLMLRKFCEINIFAEFIKAKTLSTN